MNQYPHSRIPSCWAAILALAGLTHIWGGAAFQCLAIPPRDVTEDLLNQRSTTGGSADSKAEDDKRVDLTVESTDPADAETSHKDLPWLGVSTAEASETLAAQLALQPGVGLVITYVAHDSPAAKAGLQKHDVLVGFEEQSLVHPAQLRKLVRSHQIGDKVKVEFYHAGHRHTASVALGKVASHLGSSDDEQRMFQDHLLALQNQLKDLHLDVAIRDQMNAAHEALGNLKIDQKKVQEEIRNGMEEARKALKDALRNSTNSDSALRPLRQMLDDIAGSVHLGNNASVTVRSSAQGARSIVNTDDNGTIVLVANPKLHLTAHDKDGKLLFDGEVETSEQRDKVPHDLWSRVEPLLDKMNANHAEEVEPKESQ